MLKMNKVIILVIYLSLLLAVPSLVFAASPTPTTVTGQKTKGTTAPKTTATETVKKVEYLLPYPGLLPDHPLYVVKKVRDFILDKLIVDPVRKTEFYILQADKRLNMGIFLEAKGNRVLAEEIISKGEKYMHQAVGNFSALRREGKEIPGHVADRLEKSLAKHIEVLEEMIAKTTGAEKAGLTGSLELVKSLQQEFIKAK